jgi:hypothetical protein
MADQLAEGARPLPLAVAADPGHGQLGVIVKDRQRDAAEEGEGADVAVEERFQERTFIVSDKRSQCGLRRIGLHEGSV